MQKESAEAAGFEPAPFRCPCCNRLLFKGWVKYVEIKCPKCGCVHRVSGQTASAGPPRSICLQR